MKKDTRRIFNKAIQDKVPILVGQKVGNQMYCWCPFCCTFHTHGYGEGYRGAHCTDLPAAPGFPSDIKSPFLETAYCIIDIENLKNNKGELEKPTYDYNKLTPKSLHKYKFSVEFKKTENKEIL